MNRYKELYRKLLEPFQEKLCQHVLTTCPIIVGEDYTKGTFRLLYIGRAVNGWEYNWKEDTLDGLVNQAFSQDFNLKDVENNPVQKDYNFNTTPCWQLCHQIMILKEEADAWSNKVAWSNLYKVAPYSGKNPNNRDIKTQLKVCIDLFKEEINMYKPTHIVLVTDIWWVEPFDNLPSFARELGIQLYSDSKSAIVGTGEYNGSKIVVTKRPESAKLSRAEHAKKIMEMFDKI